MPIYEYQCTACKEKTEKLQKVSDEPLVHCDACGQDALKKLVSAAGFRLKGGGWYETDFKTKSDTQRNLSDTQSATTSSSSTDSAQPGAKKPENTTTPKPSESSAGAD